MELQGRRNVYSFWGLKSNKRTHFFRVQHQNMNNYGGHKGTTFDWVGLRNISNFRGTFDN